MSKLADLLKKPTTKPVAGGGTQFGKSSAKPKQSEQPSATPTAGPIKNSGIQLGTPKAKPFEQRTEMVFEQRTEMVAAPAKHPAEPVDSPLTALANLDITLTTDVAEWPREELTEMGDTNSAATQMKILLVELSENLVTDDVGVAMQRVMVFMHENPALIDQLLPEDIQLCVKALQSSHGVVIAKKTANKKKTSVKKDAIDDLAGELADLGF